jgi:dCMP deaminase
MDITSPKWCARFLTLAKTVAGWSKDKSTKVGAVILTSDGRPVSLAFNGLPMGVDDTIDERSERPLKYKWTCHAERNAIDLALLADLSDCIMYVTFFPCSNCALSIIQTRIRTLVVDEEFTADKMPLHWIEDMLISQEMLNEAGVKIIAASSHEQIQHY